MPTAHLHIEKYCPDPPQIGDQADRITCPDCESQTATINGRHTNDHGETAEGVHCPDCGKILMTHRELYGTIWTTMTIEIR